MQKEVSELTKTIREYQREIEALRERIFIELFKGWYSEELTIDECAEISGYSKQYLYRKFRPMKIERGLN